MVYKYRQLSPYKTVL